MEVWLRYLKPHAELQCMTSALEPGPFSPAFLGVLEEAGADTEQIGLKGAV